MGLANAQHNNIPEFAPLEDGSPVSSPLDESNPVGDLESRAIIGWNRRDQPSAFRVREDPRDEFQADRQSRFAPMLRENAGVQLEEDGRVRG
jgi:hypothetical protein